jgi:hypothetical protein
MNVDAIAVLIPTMLSAVMVIWALITGKVARGMRPIKKSENPITYWFMVCCLSCIFLICLTVFIQTIVKRTSN